MFQHGTRSSIYCTYMLYMINSTFNNYVWNLTKIRHSILRSYVAYQGLSLHILVTGLGHTRQLNIRCVGYSLAIVV